MKIEIKVPAMGESISEATIGEIIRSSGSAVKIDEEILELETDKVNQMLYAQENGVVTLSVSEGETVTIGQVIGTIDTEEAPQAVEKETAKTELQPESKKQPELKPAPKSPEHGVRESKEQYVDSLDKAPEAAAKSPQAPQKSKKPGDRSEERKPMTRIRKVIAQRLVEAQQNSAMLTTFNEVDMTEVMALRAKYKDAFFERWGVKLGFMSFFVKACVSALRAVPQVNSYIDGEDIVQRHYYDIGIAVGTDRGLVVPVVRDCDQLNFAGIEQAIVEYALKARKGGLTVDDMQGGGFTVTNGGIYGSLLSTPILNAPQCGILGMHKIEERPIAMNGQVVIRPMMYLALSYDHRLIDGKEAVTFLVHVKECLEYPARDLLLE